MITINTMDDNIEISLGCGVVCTFNANTSATRRAAAHVAITLAESHDVAIAMPASLSMEEHLNKAIAERGLDKEAVNV